LAGTNTYPHNKMVEKDKEQKKEAPEDKLETRDRDVLLYINDMNLLKEKKKHESQ
jgi:hypothetical protein